MCAVTHGLQKVSEGFMNLINWQLNVNESVKFINKFAQYFSFVKLISVPRNWFVHQYVYLKSAVLLGLAEEAQLFGVHISKLL